MYLLAYTRICLIVKIYHKIIRIERRSFIPGMSLNREIRNDIEIQDDALSNYDG